MWWHKSYRLTWSGTCRNTINVRINGCSFSLHICTQSFIYTYKYTMFPKQYWPVVMTWTTSSVTSVLQGSQIPGWILFNGLGQTYYNGYRQLSQKNQWSFKYKAKMQYSNSNYAMFSHCLGPDWTLQVLFSQGSGSRIAASRIMIDFFNLDSAFVPKDCLDYASKHSSDYNESLYECECTDILFFALSFVKTCKFVNL